MFLFWFLRYHIQNVVLLTLNSIFIHKLNCFNLSFSHSTCSCKKASYPSIVVWFWQWLKLSQGDNNTFSKCAYVCVLATVAAVCVCVCCHQFVVLCGLARWRKGFLINREAAHRLSIQRHLKTHGSLLTNRVMPAQNITDHSGSSDKYKTKGEIECVGYLTDIFVGF